MQTEKKVPPANGVEFELTLDVTDPMEMVQDIYNPYGWKFTGSNVVPQTRTFKLVRVGSCANLKEVREKLAEHGSIPEGQWREAFKKTFPKHDGQGPIGFVDPVWVDPDGYAYFPMLHGVGKIWYSNFNWDGEDFEENWRWLVEVRK